MTVHKIAGGDTAGYVAYLASQGPERRRGDYYLGIEGRPAEGPGEWIGQGAAALGLSGEVDRGQLLLLWEGRDPRTGEQLVRPAHGVHTAAVDCTFSAPKSVAIVWALGDQRTRQAVELAHQRAVQVACSHLEAHSPLVRRRIGGRVCHELPQGLVIARFRHHTSRQSQAQQQAGASPDPQLHDHCVIASCALRSQDREATTGRWAAIDSRPLYRIAAEAGAVYRAELAALLQQHGYRTDRHGRYFEVPGVPPKVRQAFSSRSAEVEQAIAAFRARHGRAPTDEEVRGLVVRSRSPKTALPEDAFQAWQKRARAAGADPRGWAPEPRPFPQAPWTQTVQEVVQELTGPDSPRRLTLAAATFDTRTLRCAVAEAAQGRVPGSAVDALVEAVTASGSLVPLPHGLWTTRAALEAEQAALGAVAAHPRDPARALPGEVLARAIAGAPVPLDPEQVAAVRLACGEDGFVGIASPAGAGKGQVLQAVVQAHQQAGGRAVAVAVAGATAQRLGEQTGADVSCTLEAFLHRVETGTVSLGPGDLVALDEAGVVETTRWAALLRAAGEARVVAAGDAAQLSPIGPGGLWPLLTERAPTALLTTVYRADSPWAKDAWAALRAGASAEALQAYAERDLVLVARDREEARAQAVARWDQDRQELAARGLGPEQLLLTTDGTRAEVRDLNRRAQAARLGKGELRGEPVAAGGGRQRELAGDLEAGSSLLLYEGDLVVTTRPVYGATAQGKPTRRVENGETGVVVATDPKKNAVTVRLRDRDWVVDEEHLAALDLAYAQHLYRAQGRTVAEVLVLGGGWQTDRTTGYVGVTRAREASVVITDSGSLGTPEGDTRAALQALAARWAEAHPTIAATTLLQQAELAAAAPAELAPEPEAEPEPAEPTPEPAEPHVELEPGWTLIDELGREAERE
ncbi:MAG: relaxase domain-containing protein [Candidatus Dormibacteraeota bacterium]|nr:relaxase domain-containing protein [Candidatus Dormibacteraeota bacterium]